MRVIARGTLGAFVGTLKGKRDQQAVKTDLDSWFQEVVAAPWADSSDVKRRYATASIVNAERVVFNIKGNDYRLVVSVNYQKGIVWIIWLGTHKDYDKIDVAGVRYAG
jgi:mRNA interferase HigB